MTITRLIAWRRVLPAALVVMAAIGFLFGVFFPALKTMRHGFPTYYVSARLIWEGRWTPQVYDDAWFVAEVQALTPNGIGEIYAPNPPSASLLMLPLAWLAITPARQVWLWLNLGLLAVTLALLAGHIPADRVWARAGLVVVALVFAPLHENFRLANVYGLLLFLFTVALWQLARPRARAASAALGLAGGLKLSGSPLWLVLALRGRWRELALASVVALGIVGLSVGLTGWAGWQRFVGVVIEHAGEPGWAAGTAFQATPSFFQHMFRPDATWNPAPLWVQPAWVARACTLAVSAAALAGLLWRARRADLDVALAAAMTLGVVLLPFAEEYHYALLLLPLAVAWGQLARGAQPRPRGALAWLAVVVVLLAAPWPYKDPWLNMGWHALLAYPRLYGGWLLWGWLMACRVAVPPRQSQAASLTSELVAQ